MMSNRADEEKRNITSLGNTVQVDPAVCSNDDALLISDERKKITMK